MCWQASMPGKPTSLGQIDFFETENIKPRIFLMGLAGTFVSQEEALNQE
jgi:hypothetical protein